MLDEFAIHDILHHQKGQGSSFTISRHIVELHSRYIKIKSIEGKGCIFLLEFPIDLV